MQILKKFKYKIFFFFLLFLSAIYYYFLFSTTKHAPGKDGYWFLIQLRELLEKGKLHSYESTLLYPLYSILYFFINNYILAFKALLITLILFTALAMHFVLSEIQKLSRIDTNSIFLQTIKLIFFSLFLFSPANRILNIQYPKQGLALIFFIFSLAFYLRHFSKTKKLKLSKELVFAVLLSIIAALNHRFIAGLLALLFFLHILFSIIANKKIRIIFIFSILFIFLFAILLSLFPSTLSIKDLSRFSGSFSKHLYFPSAALLKNYPFSIIFIFESTLLFIIALLYFIYNKINLNLFTATTKNKQSTILTYLYLLSILFHIPIFHFFDLQIRFLLPAILFNYIILFYLLITNETILNFIKSHKNNIIFTLLYLFIVESTFLHRAYDKNCFEVDYKVYEKVIKHSDKFLKKHKHELLVVHKGFSAYYDYYTHKSIALPWRPENSYNKKTTYRFVYNIKLNEVLNSLNITNIHDVTYKLTNKYILLREDVWDLFINSLKINYDEELENRILFWKNPTKIRPSYLHKEK